MEMAERGEELHFKYSLQLHNLTVGLVAMVTPVVFLDIIAN